MKICVFSEFTDIKLEKYKIILYNRTDLTKSMKSVESYCPMLHFKAVKHR